MAEPSSRRCAITKKVIDSENEPLYFAAILCII
jgi:hypothetical protein